MEKATITRLLARIRLGYSIRRQHLHVSPAGRQRAMHWILDHNFDAAHAARLGAAYDRRTRTRLHTTVDPPSSVRIHSDLCWCKSTGEKS